MEQITNLLLPFGNVTLTVVGLFLLVLLLAGVYQLGIYLVRLLLALDDENAPDIKMENFIFKMLSNIFPAVKYQPTYMKYVTKLGSGWGVVQKFYNSMINNYYRVSGSTYETEESPALKHCVHETKQDAINLAKNIYSSEKTWIVDYSLLSNVLYLIIVIDITILSLQTFFFPTIIISGMGVFVWGVRTLAKKVYKNSKNIGKHEERITEIEGKLNEEI